MDNFSFPTTSESDLAWLAGFFDGDGHICVSWRRGSRPFSLSVHIGNNSGEAVARCQRILGGIARQDEGRQWVWAVHDVAAINALRWMLPYLTVKREEAEIAVRYPHGGHRRDPVTGRYLPAGIWCRIGQAIAWRALWKGVKGGFGRVPAPIG